MNYKLITNEPTEQISISWDGERFMLVKWMPTKVAVTIILNSREANGIMDFLARYNGK